MGLYLCVFDGDEDVEGVEVGSYADFEHFRHTVTSLLEANVQGSRYPTLILHSNCDGEWTPAECISLIGELRDIEEHFRRLPVANYSSDWQRELANDLGLQPQSLYDSFIDVDGVPLLQRIRELCELSIDRNAAVLFQ
jgi:hypothetical protein